MSDGTVQLIPDSTGKKVDTSEIAVGSNSVQRQRINLSDPVNPNAHAAVRQWDEVAEDDYGVVTHSILRGAVEALKRPLLLLSRSLSIAVDPTTGQMRSQSTITSGTINTVTTVTTVANVNGVAGFDAKLTMLYDLSKQSWALNVRSRIS